MEALQLWKFHENEAKHYKRKFERGLAVTFKAKKYIKLLEKSAKNFANFVGKEPNYLKNFLNTSEITKFEKVLNSEKV